MDKVVECVWKCACKNAIVLDSSFNPPTLAHLEMIQTSLKTTETSTIVLSLSATNADKNELTETQIELRLVWMRKLLDEFPAHNRTVLLLRNSPLFLQKPAAITRLLPEIKEFTFLVGDDTCERIFNQSYYSTLGKKYGEFVEFFKSAKFIVFPRKYYDINERITAWTGGISNATVLIERLSERFKNVSSSRAREILQEKPRDWRQRLEQILPPSILADIS